MKNCFYIVVCLLTIISCNNSRVKRTPNSDLMINTPKPESVPQTADDTSKQELPYSDKKILHDETERLDTSVNNFDISYIIQDKNDEIIVDTTDPSRPSYYAGREIILDVKYHKKEILHKKITRDLFKSDFAGDMGGIEKYSICSFFLDSTYLDKKIFFHLCITIPDTDVGNDYEISVSNKGEMEIKELDEPLWEDDEG